MKFFLLSARKYFSPYWMTRKQANELGGSVRKDEHGQMVVFWRVDETPDSKLNASEDPEPEEKSRGRFVLRF